MTDSNRVADLEKEVQYFKEMYELEKETNELNEIKLKELDLMNSQDRQRHEREITDWKAKLRRMELSINSQNTNESASQAFRQRIRQLEVEVTSFRDRVRIAENLATKYEEDCRAKDFKIREQVKDYEICLSKCNALELMLMTNSQMESSISLGQSISADAVESSCESPNGRTLHFGDYVQDKHCSPHTDTTCDTAPQSPSLTDAQNKVEATNGFTNPAVKQTNDVAQLNGKNDYANESAENFPNFSNFLEVDKARKYCQSHPEDVENLLKFADLIRKIRLTDSKSLKTNGDASPGRIPLAVMSGMDYLRDLQRHFSELATVKQSRSGL